MARTLTGTALVLSLSVVLAAGTASATVAPGARPGPERCDETGARPERCVGPVVDESGGGGDTLTIVVSALVGLTVAGVAFVLLRRQLARGERLMRIATWNVNSLKARLPRVEEWLQYARPDVLCLQETKLADDAFPQLAFETLGYESVHHGQGRWNGVAILSKVGLRDVVSGFGDLTDPYEGDARLLAATCGGVRCITVYVPNGRAVGTEFYDRKLVWLRTLHDWLEATASPGDELALMGDFNVAPEDRDVWSPKAFEGDTHVTPPERAAVAALEEWGLVDAFRSIYDEDRLFSYWDYRRGDFHEHRGMRIDLVLVSPPVAKRVTWALVDRNARKGQQPSDHAPVVVDLTD